MPRIPRYVRPVGNHRVLPRFKGPERSAQVTRGHGRRYYRALRKNIEIFAHLLTHRYTNTISPIILFVQDGITFTL